MLSHKAWLPDLNLSLAFYGIAQNGLLRKLLFSSFRGVRRTLCAFEEHAHNGLASGGQSAGFLLSFGAAGGGLCAFRSLDP